MILIHMILFKKKGCNQVATIPRTTQAEFDLSSPLSQATIDEQGPSLGSLRS